MGIYCIFTSEGSITATFPFPSLEANFEAIEHPPAPPPTIKSL